MIATRGMSWSGLACLMILFCSMEKARCDMPALSKEFEAYMLAHHYGAMPLDQDARSINAQTVEAKINGRRVTLLVDTGAWRTTLYDTCARRLKLDVHDSGHTEWGAGGKIKGNIGIALVQSFTLGNCEINRTNTILVFPKSAHPVVLTDGVLGLDFLRLNAVILPVGGTGFLLKPGATSVVSIESYMNKLGYKGIPLSSSRGALTVEGHLNGRPLKLMVDSGAGLSAFDPVYVRAALGRDIISVPFQAEGVDGAARETYRFTPNELDFGGFRIPPIMLVSFRSPVFSEQGFAGFLGVDLMGIHRAIIDLGDGILWMK